LSAQRPPGPRSFPENRGLAERIMMANQHRDVDQPSKGERPTAVDVFHSASPYEDDELGFADGKTFGGARSSSVFGKLGPRDYCGFEIDNTGHFESPGFEGVPTPSTVEAPVSGISGDFARGRSGRTDAAVVGGRRVGISPSETVQEERPKGTHADRWHEIGEANRPHVGVFSRPRTPEVPGYEILGELGRGGMGVVYKARQCRLNRIVALKMILAGDYAGPDAVERIMAEAEIVARLQHANIVQIYGIGDCDGRPYVELEYVGGGSLADRLDGTPWPPRAAARLVESLAMAMAEAHRMGIIHRDLKPANILMTDDGTPKITDFGLAKSIEKNTGLTRTESILGSPRYMAPEQAEGHTREVGPAADVYALGTNLYELLTGRPPFVAPTVLATLDLVKNAEPVAPKRLQPGLASDLETICLKCLRKEAAERYTSADALAEDLTRYLNDEPILARPTSSWERGWKWVRRRPSLAALVAVSSLSILASAGGGLWYRADVSRQRELVNRRVEGARNQVRKYVESGQEAVRREDWDNARTQLSSALALAHSELRLAPIRDQATKVLALVNSKIAERARRDAARARFSEFQRYYDEAVFYQSQYTGLDPDANLLASRAVARRALEQFEPDKGEGAGLVLAPAHFDRAEIEMITTRYYELALFLAEAISQALPGENIASQVQEAMRMLDRVKRVRSPTAVFHNRRAVCLEQTGDVNGAEAERRLAETMARTDHSSVDDFLEGEAAYHTRNYAKAVQAFRRVLSLEPDHFWGQYLLAICHLKEHRPSEAQAALFACQNRRPGFVWTYLLKGFAEGEMREFDLAEDDFKRATELGLGEAERYVMLVNRGVMRVRQGRHEAATEDFSTAIALKPNQFQAYIDLAQAFQKLGRLDDAMQALDRAIEKTPGQAVLHRARAQLHRLRSENEAALGDLDRAIKQSSSRDPAKAGDHLDRGLILQRAGRYVEALAECDRALELQPGRSDVHRARGAILVKLKRFDEAIRSFDVCIKKENASPILYEARGLALAYSGSYDRAIADYTLALSKGQRTAPLLTHRGWAYLFGGAPGPAVRDFDEALKRDPSDDRALSGRALANIQQHKILEAVADARACSHANAQDPRLLYNAARVYCQAAAFLEADPVRSRNEWADAGRYRALSLALIVRSLGLLHEAERAQFWTQLIRGDAALEPIRKSTKFLELEAQITRTIGRRSPAGVTPR
jgi:eukaryotic-like serine/threonine-protein kinase